MATFTAVGPALDLDGPLPVAPEYSLLTVPGVLQDSGSGRWLNGVNVYGYPCATPSTWDPCSSGTFRTKTDDTDQPLPRFDSFVAYVPIMCSSLSTVDWENFAGRAEKVLEATKSFAVEHALSQGVVQSTNPFLGDGNVTILDPAATTPTKALALLEKAIGQTGRGGLIHAPPEVVSVWTFDGGINTDGQDIETWLGTSVAVGGGYIGARANFISPGTGNAWAFASGPVEVRMSEPQLVGPEIVDALDTSNNDVTFRAERYILVEWDTCLQAAVLVDWTQ